MAAKKRMTAIAIPALAPEDRSEEESSLWSVVETGSVGFGLLEVDAEEDWAGADEVVVDAAVALTTALAAWLVDTAIDGGATAGVLAVRVAAAAGTDGVRELVVIRLAGVAVMASSVA